MIVLQFFFVQPSFNKFVAALLAFFNNEKPFERRRLMTQQIIALADSLWTLRAKPWGMSDSFLSKITGRWLELVAGSVLNKSLWLMITILLFRKDFVIPWPWSAAFLSSSSPSSRWISLFLSRSHFLPHSASVRRGGNELAITCGTATWNVRRKIQIYGILMRRHFSIITGAREVMRKCLVVKPFPRHSDSPLQSCFTFRAIVVRSTRPWHYHSTVPQIKSRMARWTYMKLAFTSVEWIKPESSFRNENKTEIEGETKFLKKKIWKLIEVLG